MLASLPVALLVAGAFMTAGREEGLPPGQQAAAAAPRLYDEGVPETGYLRVRAGDYEVVLSAAKAWTIYEIHYAGELLAGATGHYGTVLIPKGGNWIGTGHSEGGREIVHSLRLTVDGRDCAVEPGATVEGRRIELTKSSTIHKFAATHTITVTDASGDLVAIFQGLAYRKKESLAEVAGGRQAPTA